MNGDAGPIANDLMKWANELDIGYEGTIVTLRFPDYVMSREDAEKFVEGFRSLSLDFPMPEIEVRVPPEEEEDDTANPEAQG